MRVLTLLVFLLPVLMGINTARSQSDFSIANTYTIHSDILNQDRQVHIYLPESYQSSEQEYPVLYILDGQWHFTNGVAIQQSLRVPDQLPEMIVVGIQNANPLRRTLFWDERERFHSFLDNELNPFLEGKFRLADDRILFGWEAASYFACYALLHERQLFDGVILTNGGYIEEEMIDAFDKRPLPEHNYLFIANSIKDIYTIQDSDDLANLLKEKSPKNLTWKYQQYNEEVHESLPYLALYHGLNYFYHNFNSLVFSSIQAYKDLGGMTYLKQYFQARGERFGFSTEIDNSTKNSLIWLAWKRDDFESFSYFMDEFADVLSTPRYASAYWQNRLAAFYLKHNDLDHAILYYQAGISKYPDPQRLAKMHYGLGKAFLQKEDTKQAKSQFEKAVKLAKKHADPDLAQYQKQLSQLKR